MKGALGKYVKLVKDMYEGPSTQVNRYMGNFLTKIGFHLSSISPYLFVLIMDVFVSDTKEQDPWTMLFAGDVLARVKRGFANLRAVAESFRRPRVGN